MCVFWGKHKRENSNIQKDDKCGTCNIFFYKSNKLTWSLPSLSPAFWDQQLALVVKNPPAKAGGVRDSGLIPGLGRSSGGGHGQPTPVSLPGESHAQRSLVGYSP